jgi:tetraacyldisaccharide 4'-kinase
MHKKLSRYITNLWEKSAAKMRLTFFEKIVFLILCCLEKIYCPIFFITQFFKRKNSNKIATYLKIVSIGNLSVGGAGKSVFTGYLVQFLGASRCSIISRGYGGKIGRKNILGKENVLVSDGKNVLSSPDICGDEPFMLAQSLHVAVVVGKDRYKSCEIINNIFNSKIAYVILDDGYQNHKLKKDCEILLLDARSPFGNGHCLPAGCLREKDYSRANLIVLTHADEVAAEKISEIKTKFLSKFDSKKIFSGKHKQAGIFLFDEQKIEVNDYKNKNFLVIAAIGSFSGFVQSVENLGIQVAQKLQYPDHYNYSESDIIKFLDIIKKHDLAGIITTQKDWTKLSFLVKKDSCHAESNSVSSLPIFISRVTFEFLSEQDALSFKDIFKSYI